VKLQGAHTVLDHTQEDYANDILTATDGRGVDVVLEMLANVNLNRDLELMAPEGRIVIIGSRGDVAITPRHIMGRETIVTGMSLFNTPTEGHAPHPTGAICRIAQWHPSADCASGLAPG
jgi:NADPH2:quinone reductase